MPMSVKCEDCGNFTLHRALNLCDPCYQRHNYWLEPEKNREDARRSVRLTRLKRKGVTVKLAKRMIDFLEAERNG